MLGFDEEEKDIIQSFSRHDSQIEDDQQQQEEQVNIISVVDDDED